MGTWARGVLDNSCPQRSIVLRKTRTFPLGRPPLVKLYEPGDYAEGARESYLSPMRIFDQRAGLSFITYGSEGFIVRRGRRFIMVVAGFTVAAKGHADNPTVMQVYAYALDLDFGGDQFYECSNSEPKPPAILVRVRPFEGVEGALNRTWERIHSGIFVELAVAWTNAPARTV